ncbi:glycosyltransferase [Cellulomonas telluris]|uniref:glycosyltransferase n=1 Tax=Cellulomonas telluris TaxID=2306636 RepID=UPI0010A8C730|nr:glycosyltransferase [Cellulomonas telluris]
MSSRNLQLACVGALAVGLAAAVTGLATGKLDALAAIATLAALVALACAVLALRSLRARVAVGERRWREADSRFAALATEVRELHDHVAEVVQKVDSDVDRRSLQQVATTVALLDAELRAQHPGGSTLRPAVLTRPDVVSAVQRLLADGHVLEADRLVSIHEALVHLPLRDLRTLARGLRDRGYLRRAHDYFAAAAEHGDPRDQRTLVLRDSEKAVMEGTFVPSLAVPVEVLPVPRRVLHVVGRAVPTTQSGYTLRTHSTGRAQVAAGLEPHVYVQLGITATTSPVGQVDEADGVTYHRPVGDSIFEVGHAAWLQSNAEALLEVARQVRPTVLHAHSDFFNALIARAVGDVTGIPVVYEARGFWEESWLSRTADKYGWTDTAALFARYGTPEAYEWRREREADARAAADHVVTLARVMSRRIVAAGLPPERLTIVPNAVDGERFAVPERDDALAEQLGIPGNAVVVGCVTSVVEYEGIEVLLDAFARLARNGSPTWLLVVGDGPVLGHLQERAGALGLENVSFTGRVPHADVLRYYSVIDIFAVPRRPADVCRLVTPLKPFEAFATGRVVVLSDVEALQEIAEDSGAAALFPAGDPDALADVLQQLVDDPHRRAALSRAGATWVRGERSWAANARAYAALYGRLEGIGA